MEDSYEQPQETNLPTENKKYKQKWSLKKKIIVIISAIAVFIIGMVIIANTATSAPLKVSDDFVSGIQSGNASAAYNLMSSEAQTATSQQDFAAMVESIGPILTGKPNNISKEVSAETGTDPISKIVYEVSGSDNFIHILTINLVQKNGDWKVLNFESVKK